MNVTFSIQCDTPEDIQRASDMVRDLVGVKKVQEGLNERLEQVEEQSAVPEVDLKQHEATEQAPEPAQVFGESRPEAPAEPIEHPGHDELLDSDGIPWDERIHAQSKAKNQDGTWRKKRGIDSSYFEKVKAELLQRMGASHTQESPVAPQPQPQETAAAPQPQEAPGETLAEIHRAIGQIVGNGLKPVAELGSQYNIDLNQSSDQIVLQFLGIFGLENMGQVQERPDLQGNILSGLQWAWPGAFS